MFYDYSYLKGFIRQEYGTNQSYADFLGIGTTSLYNRLANRVPFTQEEIDRTAKRNNLSADRLVQLFFTRKNTENRTA